MSDRVRFPNYFATAHSLVLDLLFVAYFGNMLPPRYNLVAQQLPEGYQPTLNTYGQIYAQLGKMTYKDLGSVADVNLKHLFSDMAIVLFKRGIRCCSRIQDLIRNRSDLGSMKSSKDWEYFAADIVLLKTILDIRRCFIPNPIMLPYLGRLEAIQNYSGYCQDIEDLCRKMRAMTKPKKVTMPTPTEVTANTQAQSLQFANAFRQGIEPDPAA